jgi:hypothetical protein
VRAALKVVEVWCCCYGPLEVVKAEVDLEVASASSASCSRRRLFCASWKDENGLVRFRTVFKLSNFLFNPQRRFITRVRSSMCVLRLWRLLYMVFSR